MSSSANIKRIISKKRNALPALLSEADSLTTRDITDLDSSELRKVSVNIDKCRGNLRSSLDVIYENGKRWNTLIASIEDASTKEQEQREMTEYFTDTSTNPLKSVEALHEEITTRIFSLDSCITSISRLLEHTAVISRASAAQQSSTSDRSLMATMAAPIPLPSLPNLTLPSYDGKSCWDTFWNTFKEIIDKRVDLGDSTKLRYLEGSLRGEASDLMNHLMKRNCGYRDIVKSLENEYQSTVKSQKQILREFNTLRPKGESIEEQLKAIRAFETLITQLKGMNADPDNNPFCLHNAIERFSSFSQKFIHIKMREGGDETALSLSDALSALKQKLKDELELRELCPKKEKAKVNSSSTFPSNTPITAVNAQASSKRKEDKGYKSVKKGKEGKEKKEQSASLKSFAKGSSDKSDEKSAQKCIFCGEHSNSRTCWKVKQAQKRVILIQQGRCLKCFQQGHTAAQCTKPNCEICSETHNVTVCQQMRTVGPWQSTKSFVPRENGANVNTAVTASVAETPVPIAVATSTERIRMLTGTAVVSNSISGRSDRVDVFLDCGSGVNLISKEIRDQLSLTTIRRDTLNLAGVGGICHGTRDYDVVLVSLSTNNGPMILEAVVHSEPLTGSIPMANLSGADKRVLKHQGVRLADSVHRRGRVQPSLLIGGKDFYLLTGLADNKLPSGLYVVNTAIGAMIVGEKDKGAFGARSLIPINTLTDVAENSRDNDQNDQNKMLSDFLALDSAGKDDQMNTEKKNRAAQERVIQEKFENSIQFKDGHYHARYSFNEKLGQLTDGFNQAWIRLKSMYKKIGNDRETLLAVSKIFEKQIEAGQIEIVQNGEGGEDYIRYIPLQLVIKHSSETTPYRVVIDASAHGKNEPSLNECLEGPGANLLEEIPKMLIRLQLHEVLFAGDIEKAFLQVKIFPDQRDLLRVLWLKDPMKPPSIENLQILRYCSAAFGIAQSPFILMATLRHHAKGRLEVIERDYRMCENPDEKQLEEWNLEYTVLESLLTNCYVDNVFFSCHQGTNREALFKMAKRVFQSMGMNIRSFFSSDVPFIQTLSLENGDQGPTRETKILGVGYDTTTDEWILNCDLSFAEDRAVHKRILLSNLASVYFPRGDLLPLLLPMKHFIQKLWLKEYGWDDPLDEEDTAECARIVKAARLSNFRLPRHIPMPSDVVHLVLFTDGSFRAMGAVVYMWTPNGAKFLMARNQLAPIRAPKTTPKIELQALVMGMNLLLYVTKAIAKEHPLIDFVFQVYTDATTILYWLESDSTMNDQKKSKNLGVYVTNRIQKIREVQSLLEWHSGQCHDDKDAPPIEWIRYDHVPGPENPADHATRGLTAEEISDPQHIWWKGPEWLSLPPDQWKREFCTDHASPTVSEIAQEEQSVESVPQQVLTITKNPKKMRSVPDAIEPLAPLDLVDMTRFSRFDKMCRSLALVLRFIKLRCPITSKRVTILRYPPQVGPPSKGELEESRIVLTRQHQRANLSSWTTHSEVRLMTDDHGLIRVTSGRVDNAMIEESAKQPILLFSSNPVFPSLLIDHTHRKLMHRGAEHVLAELRDRRSDQSSFSPSPFSLFHPSFYHAKMQSNWR